MDPLSSAALGSLYAAMTATWLRTRLRAGTHRRGDAETHQPPRRYHWLIPTCAAAAALLAWQPTPNPILTVALITLTPLYGYLAAIDIDVHRLPDALTLPAYPLAALAAASASLTTGEWANLTRALTAALTITIAWTGLHLLSRGQLGLGDVKLAGSLAIYLGWIGWTPVLTASYATFLIAAIPALGQLLIANAGRTARIPLGPCITLGALAATCA